MDANPAVRRAARDAEGRLRFVARRAKELAAAAAASGLAFHPALGLAAVSAFAGVPADSAADQNQRLADDPPRSDFQSRTRSRRRPLRPQVLTPHEAPGAALRSSLAAIPRDREAGTAFAIAAEDERAHTSALVRAYERALAARDLGQREFADARLAEAARF